MSKKKRWAVFSQPGEGYINGSERQGFFPTRKAAREYARWLRQHPGTLDVDGKVWVVDGDLECDVCYKSLASKKHAGEECEISDYAW